MRRPTLKRLMLGLVQQTAALLLLVAIAAVLFNSYLAVDTADGTKVYELSPLDAETEFEDSVIFHDLLGGFLHIADTIIISKPFPQLQ